MYKHHEDFVLLCLPGNQGTLACGGELDGCSLGGGDAVCVTAKYVRGLAGM